MNIKNKLENKGISWAKPHNIINFVFYNVRIIYNTKKQPSGYQSVTDHNKHSTSTPCKTKLNKQQQRNSYVLQMNKL